MINYIEKGIGLHDALQAAGIKLVERDGVWISSDDVGAQAIIDSFDPVPYEQEMAKARLVIQFDEATKALQDSFPEAVKLTFTKQEFQAREYQSSGIAGSTLQTLADKRGLTLTEMSNKIIDKADTYQGFIDNLNGDMQKLEDDIESSVDWKEIQGINLI